MTNNRLQATAYHEAGHAVITHHLGYGFHYVTIAPDEETGALGHVNIGIQTLMLNLGRPGFIKEAREQVIHSLAGPLAEERFTGTYDVVGAGGDEIRCRYILIHTYGYEAYEYHLAALQRRAKKLVAQHWRDIETIARLLLEREKLTGNEIKQVLTV